MGLSKNGGTQEYRFTTKYATLLVDIGVPLF